MTSFLATAFASFSSANAAIKEARAAAHAEARREGRRLGFPTTRSRGTFLSSGDSRGQCAPFAEAECIAWDGTKADLNAAIARILAEYPEVQSLSIAGGFDAAISPRDFADSDGDYEPRVSEWAVTVWERTPTEGPTLRSEVEHFATEAVREAVSAVILGSELLPVAERLTQLLPGHFIYLGGSHVAVHEWDGGVRMAMIAEKR